MNRVKEQTEVIDFLASAAAFPRSDPIERIDTHGAHIFLCGGTALKLKRAVKYDYMDLSTPDRRRRMLERELELNKPAAPMIYDTVLPVTRGPDGLSLGGDGPALDWVLRMNRFSAEDELEAIAERGALDGALADELGRMVARYHFTCPELAADGALLIEAILDELGRVFREYSGAAGTEKLQEWMTASRLALHAVAPLLTERGRTGHVRRGHGDLHLRNIVMVNGVPTPFDALEFDETLATCDVLYDLAFLLMDLGHRGLRGAATRALSAYLLATRGQEDPGLAALPLFISVRAAIRAMVLLQTDDARDRKGASASEVAAYLREACAALAARPPMLVAIGGLSGTGKTVLARALLEAIGPTPGAVHLSTDAERKAAHNRSVTEHLPETAYAAAARSAVYDVLQQRAEAILGAGYGVILDGTFLDPEKRREVGALGTRLGVRTACLWLSADARCLEERVSARKGDASDADVTVLRRQLATGAGEVDWTLIDASGNREATLQAARAALSIELADGDARPRS